MKKFTMYWRLLMVLILSATVLIIQAQKNESVERAPVKKVFNEDQIKTLEEAGMSVKEIKEGTFSAAELANAELILKEMNAESEMKPVVPVSSKFVDKFFNPDESITVTLGTGTGSNTTTGNPTPYGTYYKNFRQQYLILASELLPLGIGAGDITALGFNVAALNNCVDMPNFTISMKQTTVTALTTAFDNTGLIQVFTLPTFMPVVGWNTHAFDTPFTWDGSSNLLIDICTTLIPGAYTQNASVYFTPTTGTNTCARYQSDTNPACLCTNTGTISVNRANMQITGEEMLNPPPGAPYGEIPPNGTIDVPIEGDISWTFGNNTDTYDLWFGPTGNMIKVIDNQPAGGTGIYTYTGLSYATGYSWQVVAMNANGNTNGPIWNFSTLCGTISVFPWMEGFEGVTIPALPACWLEENGDWVTTNNAASTYDADAHTGTQFLRESYNATNEYVWTPGFGLDAGVSYDFSFWWAGDNYSGWTGDIFYNTTQNSAGAIQMGEPFVVGTTVTTKTYDVVTRTLVPSAAETYYFAIRVNCPTSTPWYLSFDDFRLELTPPCPNPSSLGAANITGTSADLTWTSQSGISDIEFGLYGFTPTGIPTAIGVISPYAVGGLSPSTHYSFYVRDDCGGGDYSNWAGPYSFFTACATFTAPFVEHFQNTTIPLCWEMSGPQVWLFTNTWPGYGAAGLQDHTGTGGSFTGVDGSGTVSLTGITLLTPLIDVTTLTVPQLRFYLFNNNINNTDWLSLSVDLWDGAAWNNSIFYWGPADNDPEWVEVMVILSAYNITGDIKIRFVVDKSPGSPFYDDLIIDDVFVEEAPTCPAPALLGATYIATTTADLTWTSFSGLSDIEFGLAGFVPTGIPTYSGVVSPYTVTGLTAVTGYSFYVRDDCGGGDFSLWTGPFTFTTQPSCPQPFDLGAINVTMTTADLIWSSFTGLSDVEFGPAGFTPTGIPTYTGVVSPYNLSGLNTASPYDFYVRDDCGGGDYSLWSGPYTFLTMPGTQTLPVVEDFENGFVYFNNPAGNGADWSINNTYYHSGAQCAINVYANSQTNILHETGVIDLSGATVVWLDFWQIAKTEGNYDHCIVEISIDGGLNYTPLPLSTYTGSGNYHVPTANAPFEICFDEDSYGIWGTGSEIPDNATWWQQETFDLSDYLTSNVRIRFRLHTDGSVIRYGWLLDDIFIYEPAYGTLAGTVTNAANSNPIEGAQISMGSLNTLSGTDGTYSLPGILVGTWNALCSKTGFNPVTASVTIVEDQTTTQDFVLTEPGFVVTPLIINDTLEPNQLLDDFLNVSNPGLGTVEWNAGIVVIGDDGTDELFDLLFDWPVGIGGGEAGIECDGNYIYTTKWNGSEFYKYDLTGTYIGPFACGAAGAIRDLAYNGTYFYGAAAAATIFEMDFTNQVVVSTFTAPIAVRALAYNEDDDVFYGNNWSDAITMFNTSGANLGSFPCGPIGTDYYGFAYDNYSPGAPYLWGYAQTGATLNELVQIQLPTGVETGIQFDVGSVAAVGAGIAGGLAITQEIVPGLFTILGTSQNVDIWGLELSSAGPVWLTLEPEGGLLGAGSNEDMTLHFNATDLLPGIYQAEIHFTTDPNVGSPIVDVTMVVEGLIPPVNLTSDYECTDVSLGWEMPVGGIPDSWNVYRDGVLLGNSTVMSYTDELVMPEVEYGYYIKAVYAGEESMPSATESVTVPVPPDLEIPFIDGTASGTSAIIEWEAPTGCLIPDGYNLYRDGAMINTSLITDLTYTDPDLVSGFYEYYATAVYYFGESDPSDPTYVLIVGIEEQVAGSLQVYPNPTSDNLNIKSGSEIQSIRIYNNSGNLIREIKINASYFNLDVSEFDCGVYYLGLTTDEGAISRKITVR